MKTLTILLAMAIGFVANAQTSQSILDELSQKAKTFNTIEAEFTSRLVDQQSGLDVKQTGEIKTKGEKYVLKIDEFIIWNNGESQWVYHTESNECTIDDIEDLDEDALSPTSLFTIWEDDFKHQYDGDVDVAGKKAHLIKLFPNNPKDKPFHTIELYVDKAKMEIAKVVVKGREGDITTYEIKSFKTNTTLQDSEFKFSEADFPGVQVSDNRI